MIAGPHFSKVMLITAEMEKLKRHMKKAVYL